MGDYTKQPPSVQDFTQRSVQAAMAFYEEQWFATHKYMFRPSGGQTRALSALFSPRLTDRYREREDWQLQASGEGPRRKPRQALVSDSHYANLRCFVAKIFH